MLEFSTTKPSTEDSEERIPLFSVDGVEYGMRKDISAAFALEVAEQFTRNGPVAGLAWVLRKVVGDAGIDALYSAHGVKREDIAAIEKIVRDHVMGAMEDNEAPGKSPSAD